MSTFSSVEKTINVVPRVCSFNERRKAQTTSTGGIVTPAASYFLVFILVFTTSRGLTLSVPTLIRCHWQTPAGGCAVLQAGVW